MELKANLHFHTKEDPYDFVKYSLKEGIDHASERGFSVLAVTCHRYFAYTEDAREYAESKGILLIPGIESNIDEDPRNTGRHVLILNGGKDSEKVESFEHLKQYKKEHPEVFVIAPHPYFYGNFSLDEYLEEYIDLFDAIEHSWFYSKKANRNEKAVEIAKKYNKPLISTSDTHFLRLGHMDRNYAVVDAESKDIEAFFNAIREGKFKNVTEPSSFVKHMLISQGWFFWKNYFKKRSMKKQYARERRERYS